MHHESFFNCRRWWSSLTATLLANLHAHVIITDNNNREWKCPSTPIGCIANRQRCIHLWHHRHFSSPSTQVSKDRTRAATLTSWVMNSRVTDVGEKFTMDSSHRQDEANLHVINAIVIMTQEASDIYELRGSEVVPVKWFDRPGCICH